MPELHEYPFAEIDSKEEIVVHLGRLAEPMNVVRLAELLRIPATSILAHSSLPLNEEFARRLYASVRATYQELPPTEGGNAVALPEEAGLTQFEVTIWMMSTWERWRGEGQPDLWELPPVDVYLPRGKHLTDQLKLIQAKGTRHDRLIEVERLELALAHIEPLTRAVEKLEAAIERRVAEMEGSEGSYGEVFGGLSTLRGFVGLQSRHWATTSLTDASREEIETHQASIANVVVAIEVLGNAVWRRFDAEYLVPERKAAAAVLDMLSAPGDADVLNAIELACVRLADVESGEADRVIRIAHRACSALARSVSSRRFVDEHVIDILEQSGADLGAAQSKLLEEYGAFGGDVIKEWKAAVEELRRGGEVPEARTSVLRYLEYGVRTYRLGLSAISAVLEEGVVAQVMLYLVRGQRGAALEGSRLARASRNFALVVLRGLASNAVQHRATKDELFVVGGERLRNILRTLRTIDDEAAKHALEIRAGTNEMSRAAFWSKQGARLKDLQVRPLPRSAAGASSRLAISFAALMLASGPAFDGEAMLVEEFASCVSAALNVTEHIGRRLEFVRAGAPETFALVRGDTVLQSFDRTMKTLASAAAGFGVIANLGRLKTASDQGDTWQMAIELCGGVSNAAVAIGQAMMGPLQSSPGTSWMLRVGAFTNGFGVALAIGLFLAQIVRDVYKNIGMAGVLYSTLGSVQGLKRAAGMDGDFDFVRSAIASASASLTELRANAGRSSDNPWTAAPSYWAAAKLGLSERAIAHAFGASMVEVTTHLAPFFDKAAGGGPE